MADIRGSNRNDPTTASLPHNSLQPLALGTLMYGRYRVVSQVGKGGMSYVYLVQDEHFDARPLRSMKEMIPRLDDRQQYQQLWQHYRNMASFKREADVLETLRHPNIPRVYDSFTEFRRAYLVLEYVEGEDLEHVLDRTPGFLSPQQVGSWMIQLCTIVEYLHSHKPPIIFRDLKPSNVILTPDQRIILIDFGIAKVFLADETQTNVGTQGYAAREQYKGEAEIRSDIYAFGSMMHHLLTRSDPRFEAPFSFRERSPRAINPTVSEELERVIMRCLEDDRDKRYQSVTELREALEDALHLSDTSTVHTLETVRSTPAAADANVLGLGAAGAVADLPTIVLPPVADIPTLVLPRDAASARGADSASGGRASSVSSISTGPSALPTPKGSPKPSGRAARGTSPSAGKSPTPVPTAPPTPTPAPPILTVSPTSLTLTTYPAITHMQFTIFNAGGMSFSWAVSDNGSGYHISPASGSIAAGGQATVTVSNILLSGSVTVSAPGAQHSPQHVSITCSV